MFAAPADFEPGMWLRDSDGGAPLEWLGVESVRSRFPGKSRVRVLVGRGGVSFVCDSDKRFQVIDWVGRRG